MVYSQLSRINIARRASAAVATANTAITAAAATRTAGRVLSKPAALRQPVRSIATGLTSKAGRALPQLQQHRFQATAVQRRRDDEDLNEPAGNGNGNAGENGDVMSYGKRITRNFVETSLSRIDANVKRLGRVPLQSFQNLMEGILSAENTAENVVLTSTHALLLLRCCGSLLPELPPAQRNETLQKLWQHLKQLDGLRLDVSHYNAYLKALLENNARFSPVDLLARMERDKIDPNRVTYQRVIAYYCQQGDIEATTKILEFMKSNEMPVNEYVFKSLIQGHARAKDMPNAEKILDVMRAGNVEPDAVIYAALLEGYAANGQMDKVRETLQNASEKFNINFSHRELLGVLKAFAVNGHLNEVQDLIGIMPKVTGYSQDCMNTVIELANSKALEAAYKLLLTLNPPEDMAQKSAFGMLFMKQLIANSSDDATEQTKTVDLALGFCEDLRSSQFNPYAYQRACEIAVRNGKLQVAAGLLRKMHELGMPIRTHYFWPLLARVRNSPGPKKTKEVWDLVNLMQEVGMQPSLETMTDYILPILDADGQSSAEELVEDLRARVGQRGAVLAVLRYKIRAGAFNDAADLWDRYEIVTTNPEYIWRAIADETGERQDAQAAARLFSLMLQRGDRGSTQVQQTDWHDLLRQFLNQTVQASGGNEEFAVNLVTELSKRRVPVTPDTLHVVFEDRYGRRWQDETYKKLAKAATQSRRGNIFDADLGGGGRRDTQMGMMRQRQQRDGRMYGGENDGGFQHPQAMDVDALQAHLIELESKNMSTRGVLRRLVLEYARLGQLEKMEDIKKRLDAEGFVYSAGMMASLMETYVRAGEVEKALEMQQILHEQYPDFKLDGFKVLNLATLLVKKERLADATDMIAKAFTDNKNQPLDVEAFDRVVFRLLNAAAERGDPEAVDTLWESLSRYTNVKNPTPLIAGPFIKAHVMKSDWEGAMRAFEQCVGSYRLTPWKNELMKHFIQEEDAASLQRLLDLSISVYGELNSLYDLAFCFLELGRKKQAEKIFDTPGMRARQDRLESFCDTFVKNGALEPLQSLMQVTRNLFDVDRDAMYYHLIRGYRRAELVDQAVPIWTDMQEEGVQPSVRTMKLLATFLRENGREVPFAVPEVSCALLIKVGRMLCMIDHDLQPSHIQQEVPTNIADTPDDDGLQQHIRKGDAVRALAAYRRSAGGEGRSIRVQSNLIELLIKTNRINEALAVTHDMLEAENNPFPAVLKFLLTTLNTSGQVDAVRDLCEKLPPKISSFITSDQHMFDAYVNAGRGDEILREYEKLVATPDRFFNRRRSNVESEASSPGEQGQQSVRLGSGSIFRLLERNPEFEQRVQAFGDKLAANGIYQAVHALWEFYFTRNRQADAQRISKQYPESVRFQRVMRVCSAARAQNDVGMLRTLIEDQLASGNRDNACIAYSFLIGLLTHNNEYDAATKVVTEELPTRGIALEELRSTPLRALHAALKQQKSDTGGGEADADLPFQVPEEKQWGRDAAGGERQRGGQRGRGDRRGSRSGSRGNQRNYDDLSAAEDDQALMAAEENEHRGDRRQRENAARAF